MSEVWTDKRRVAVTKSAKGRAELRKLTAEQINKLYDVVLCEAENWDGEHVPYDSIVQIMVDRYEAVGLIPSRN